MGHGFDYWDPERPAALFYLSAASIMGLYAFAAHWLIYIAGRATVSLPPATFGRNTQK